MAGRLGVIVIHGMGSQQPGYSKPMRGEITRLLGSRSSDVAWTEIYWAKILKSREDRLWEAMMASRGPDGARIPLDWQDAREFVVHNFGDAVAYHRDAQRESAYQAVHRAISKQLVSLKEALVTPDTPIVVIAHSLGAHMMSNYIWDTQLPSPGRSHGLEPIEALASMVTFGCNIPLFSLAFEAAVPIDIPGRAVTDPALVNAARWLNFTDRDDVLGWPLRRLYAKSPASLTPGQLRTIEKIRDYEINVGGLSTSWNPIAHGRYWTDDDFTEPVAHHLGDLLEVL